MIEFFAARAGLRINDVDTLGFTASGSATILAERRSAPGRERDAVRRGRRRRRSARSGNGGSRASASRSTASPRSPGSSTPIAISTVDLDGGKSYAFYRFRGICDPLDELSLSSAQEQSGGDADVLVLTEAAVRGPGSRRVVERLIELRARRPRADDPRASTTGRAPGPAPTRRRGRLARIGNAVSVVCANGDELELLRGGGLETDLIFETLGAAGVRMHEGDRRRAVAVAPPPRSVVLDTGAGDSFCGAVAVALGERRSPEAAARFASAVAALAITRPGLLEAAPRRDEVEAYLQDVTDMEAV